jgi:hypothetical protein
MSTSPSDLLSLAVRLKLGPDDEATRRCIVSRAYYASLHAVDQTFAQQPGAGRRDGESSHAEIISRATTYGNGLNPGRSEARNIAQVLPGLRRLRNRADYRVEEGFSESDCHGVMQRAALVLELCEAVAAKRAAANP